MLTPVASTLLGTAVTAEQGNADGDGASLDEDVVFDLLGNDRRRVCLKELVDAEEVRDLNDLSEQVAAQLDDSSTSTDELYESVYISLCQSHLPKLEKVDLVEFDSDQKTVEPRPALDEIERHLHRNDEEEAPESTVRYPFVAAAVTGLGIAVVIAGPQVVGSLVLPLLFLLNAGVIVAGVAREGVHVERLRGGR